MVGDIAAGSALISETQNMAIIEAHGLARTFKTRKETVTAVRGVDLTVHEGEIVGFLGPNGAGKTTTLRMLTTLLRPTAGSAMVAGADLVRDPAAVRRAIGYVPQAMGATGGGSHPRCRVRDELALQAGLHRLSPAEARRRSRLLLGQLELDGLEGRMIQRLSGGQRRRLEIALGLVHSPRVIFLDEPSTGLDPQSRSHLWDHVRALRSDLAATVFLTTHYLDEADSLCDRILVIDDGRIVAEGSPAALKGRLGGDVITLRVGDPGSAKGVLVGLPGLREMTADGNVLRLTIEHGEYALPAVLRVLDQSRIPLESVEFARPTLDDVFLTLTGRSLRDSSRAGSRDAA
jgi:ABC-2 type transport system ATP-binding protein